MSPVLPFPARNTPQPSRSEAPPAYAELIATSNFSFLHSGSHPEELVLAAMEMGFPALGLCDRNSFAGVVRGYVAARDNGALNPGFRYLVGVRLCFADGTPDIIAYPADRPAYGRLCQMLTRANQRGEKGRPFLELADLVNGTIAGQLLILLPDEADWEKTEAVLARLCAAAPGAVWVAATPRFDGRDRARLNRVAALGQRHGAPMLASNDVLYHEPARRIVADVVACIREHQTLRSAGWLLSANAERHLKPPAEMARLFAEHPDAIAQTLLLAGRIGFCLDQLHYNYPEETIGTGETAQQTLERLTWAGAARRFGPHVPNDIREKLWSELCLIAYKGYAAYFLTVEDIVRYARQERGILCQGRGSAANSTVCYCLGITEVNPRDATLVFGRFISVERDEPPDIDVDFEHERREEVMAYVYAKYGGKRTGLTANVICYRSRSAIREAAKVFGVSDDVINAFNQLHWGWGSQRGLGSVRAIGLNPDDPVLARLFEVVKVLRGFPRHLSQHVGGFVITRDDLESLVPIGKTAMQTRTIIEWNKDDIDALKILKVDILALGMLSCLKRAFGLMEAHYGQRLQLADLMAEEKHPDQTRKARVYAMVQRADTLGVFQIESRAQMTMLPRLKPRRFYDLVIEVAIVRPGPIQGGMVHPYLRRREGFEPWQAAPDDPLDQVLKETLGIPLFQEQAMQMAIIGAGFTPGEADQLRRAMAAWRRTGRIDIFRDRFIEGMTTNSKRAYSLEFAERCFSQIEGFAEYGFPESHAASFALLVYASCWLKCHYPDVFACALLNSQPMGFYAPGQIVRDAAEHGVEVRPTDINHSGFDCLLEDGGWAIPDHIHPRHAEMTGDIFSGKALRLGLRLIEGLAEKEIARLLAARQTPYLSVRDLWLRARLSIASLERLARADAFRSLGLNRREALWAVKGLIGTHGAETLPLFTAAGPPAGQPAADPSELPAMTAGEEVIHDYASLSLSLKGHPVQFLRPMLQKRGVTRAANLAGVPAGQRVEVAGLVLVRQRPGTASGVIFVTLEDETGIANVVVWPKVFGANRKTLLAARLLAVHGQVQSDGKVVHLIAEALTDMTAPLLDLLDGGEAGRARPEARAALPGGRNFH